VNKKKQKNFDNLGLRRTKIPAQEEQKFFAPLFFKKAAAVFLSCIGRSLCHSVVPGPKTKGVDGRLRGHDDFC
jgi:hypothetical protein